MLPTSRYFRLFSAVFILTLPGLSGLSAGPAIDLLTDQAGPYEFTLPEPSGGRLEKRRAGP